MHDPFFLSEALEIRVSKLCPIVTPNPLDMHIKLTFDYISKTNQML